MIDTVGIVDFFFIAIYIVFFKYGLCKVTMTIDDRVLALKALANENRLQIIEWILDPRAHFEEQVDGDLVDDGVCIGRIVEKIGLSQPTITSHMQVLANAGLVSSKKIKNWVFYKPNRTRLSTISTYLNIDTNKK